MNENDSSNSLCLDDHLIMISIRIEILLPSSSEQEFFSCSDAAVIASLAFKAFESKKKSFADTKTNTPRIFFKNLRSEEAVITELLLVQIFFNLFFFVNNNQSWVKSCQRRLHVFLTLFWT